MESPKLINRYLFYLTGVLLGLCFACASFAATPQKVPTALETARENLRISQATAKRIAAELEQLKRSGKASSQVIKDYEIYLDRVQAMVAENQKIVDDMEATYARYAPETSTSGSAPAGQKEKMLDPDIPEQQTVDELAALDRELDQSLSEFDEMLLKELETIQAKSADKMRNLAREAAEAAKRLKSKGGESESQVDGPERDADGKSESQDGNSEQSEDGDKQSKDQNKGDSDRNEESDNSESADSDEDGREEKDVASTEGTNNTRKGPTGEGYAEEDEDIVARQLREAAENETDPELKEKLWEEYEEYMKTTQ